MNQRTKAELLLVLAAFIWGTSFVIIKGALADAAPFPFNALRFALGGLLMWGVMVRGLPEREAVLPCVLLGILLFAGFSFQTWGLVYTAPSKSAFITSFSVILVPLISLFHGYPLRAANAAGAGLGFLGLYFLVLPSGISAVNRGDLLTLLCAIIFAVHIVLLGDYARRVSFMQLAAGQTLVAGMIAILAVPFGPSRTVHWSGRLVIAIVVVAIFATAFAFGAQVWAQQHTPPAHTALIFTLEPVFAALTSRIFTGEHLGRKGLFGSALILLGMVVSDLWGRSAPTAVEE